MSDDKPVDNKPCTEKQEDKNGLLLTLKIWSAHAHFTAIAACLFSHFSEDFDFIWPYGIAVTCATLMFATFIPPLGLYVPEKPSNNNDEIGKELLKTITQVDEDESKKDK